MRMFLYQNKKSQFAFVRCCDPPHLPHALGPWFFYSTFELSPITATGRGSISALEIIILVMRYGYYVSPFKQGECCVQAPIDFRNACKVPLRNDRHAKHSNEIAVCPNNA